MSAQHLERSQSLPEALRLAHTRLEAARLLGISPNSLDRLVRRGLLKPSRALRRPLFSLRELQRFLDETE